MQPTADVLTGVFKTVLILLTIYFHMIQLLLLVCIFQIPKPISMAYARKNVRYLRVRQ